MGSPEAYPFFPQLLQELTTGPCQDSLLGLEHLSQGGKVLPAPNQRNTAHLASPCPVLLWRGCFKEVESMRSGKEEEAGRFPDSSVPL